MSRLLDLPAELRTLIIDHVLLATTLRFDARAPHHRLPRDTLPDPFGILRVSRQINEEAKDRWLSHVTFRFEDTERFLDVLTALALSSLVELRKVIVDKPQPLCLRSSGQSRY